jgi:hypothetical protein
LTSTYDFEEELYQKYMKKAVIISTIEKPVTMNRPYQSVREELSAYHIGRSDKYDLISLTRMFRLGAIDVP